MSNKGFKFPGQARQMPAGLRPLVINEKEHNDIICGKCGNRFFQPAMRIKKISAIHPVNRSGKDEIVQLPVIICTAAGCGQVLYTDGPQKNNDEINPATVV